MHTLLMNHLINDFCHLEVRQVFVALLLPIVHTPAKRSYRYLLTWFISHLSVIDILKENLSSHHGAGRGALGRSVVSQNRSMVGGIHKTGFFLTSVKYIYKTPGDMKGWSVNRAVEGLTKSLILQTADGSAQYSDIVCLLQTVLRNWSNRWAGQKKWKSFLNKSSFLHEMEETIVPLKHLLEHLAYEQANSPPESDLYVGKRRYFLGWWW